MKCARKWLNRFAAVVFVLLLLPAFAGAVGQQEKAEEPTAQMAAPSGEGERWATPADYEKATGQKVGAFKEAPMLEEMVANGQVLPVAERLPVAPLVVRGVEGVGTYGERLRIIAEAPSPPQFNREVQISGALYDFTVGAHSSIGTIEMSDSVGREWMVHLREGMKWSDGKPFTADDALFWYEDIALNEELSPSIGGYLKVAGELIKIEKIDDYSYKLSASQPFHFEKPGSIHYYVNVFPKHFLKDYHPTYTEKSELDKKVKEKGFDSWMQLFQDMADRNQVRRPGFPTISPWMVSQPAPATPVIYTRNPYYWVVDEQGNQLPYIDELRQTIVGSAEARNLKILAGEVDWAYAGSGGPLYPLLKDAEKTQGKIVVARWPEAETNAASLYFNFNHTDPVLKTIFQDKRFRFAVSYALDRETINELIYLGVLEPYQVAPLQSSPFKHERLAKTAVEYDLPKANALLDEMGLDKKDGEGFRLRPDGKRLFASLITFPMWGSFPEAEQLGEIVVDNLKEIGIEVNLRIVDWSLFSERTKANEFDGFLGGGTWSTLEGSYLSGEGPAHWVSLSGNSYYALRWREWYNSEGKSGEKPSDEMLLAIEAFEKAKASFDDQEVAMEMKKILDIAADNLWTVGFLTKFGRTMVFNSKLGNAPTAALNWWRGDKGRPETYYWKD